jgi:hypothetical protein
MAPDDIKFYHSGGGSNCDPDNDLGGAISTCELHGGLNTLLDDHTPKQSRKGVIDYRCFYIKNTNGTETLRNTKVYIDSEKPSGSFIDLGVNIKNEVQIVNVAGNKPPNEGDSMNITVPGYGSFTVYYHVNPTQWQGRFQTEIRGLEGLNDVKVSVVGIIGFPTDITFTLYFDGDSQSRNLGTMTVANPNSLDGCTITISTTKHGAPISTTACAIPDMLTAPACADFRYPLRGDPIELGDLRPGEFFPLWVRRTTPAKTIKLTRDNFRINVDGTFP